MDSTIENHTQEYLTLKEAALLLKCHQKTLRVWDKNGVFKAVRLGKRNLLRYRKKDIQKLLDSKFELGREELVNDTSDKFPKIRKFLIANADSIQKLATKEHKKFLGGNTFRSEIMQEYQDLHISTVEELAKNLNDDELNAKFFRKLGIEIAIRAVEDNLTIEEAVDGIIFLKQGIWKSLNKEKLLELLNNREFYLMNLRIGTLCDIAAAQIAFTFHDNAIKKRLETEEDLNLILNNIKDYGIMRFDVTGNITYWNTGAERLLRYSEKEIIGKNYANFFTQEEIDNNKHLRELQSARKKGSVENENWSVRHDGSKFWASGTTTALFDENNKLYGFIKIIRDRTELKELEKQKDEFVAIISHELKNPITSILIFTQILQKQLKKSDDELALKAVDTIKTQTDKLTELISNLLERSKIRSKSFIFKDIKFGLDAVIEQTIYELQTSKATHELIFRNKSEAILFADKGKIGQLLYNLISNAIKYSPDAKKVIIYTKKEKKYVTVTIQDFGLGISQENIDKLFTPFFRASDTQREAFPSMGLGLYISSEIVKHYRGKIWVESKRGKGSQFSFTLPLSKKSNTK